MGNVLAFLLFIAIIVAIAKAAGYLSTRLRQPAVLGEILAGLVLGPTMLNMLHWGVFEPAHLEQIVRDLAEVGVLFLMFIAGLEVDLESMWRAGRPATLAGVLGVIFPVAGGAGVALAFHYPLDKAIFVGLVLAATSVSISAQTLLELGVLRSNVGITLLSAAVVDDVLVILLLSIFVALAGGGGGILALAIVLVKMLLFLAIAGVIGLWALPWLAEQVERLPISEGLMALVIVLILLYSWSAEAFGGMAAITGAFLAGVMFGRTRFRQAIETSMHTIAYSWLVPIFFVSIGLEANARSLGRTGIPLALSIVLIAMLSKLLGAGLGTLIAGFRFKDAVRMGVGMISRGEVGLIVASVGLSNSLISDQVFASVVVMVLATTLMTPVLLRLLYPAESHKVTERTPSSVTAAEASPIGEPE